MTQLDTNPRKMASRPPLERMVRIHQAVQSGALPNATKLAAELEVSTKSIQRDIEFMRDRLELPIEYDPHKFGYHYTAEVTAFPTLHITEGELVALVTGVRRGWLSSHRGEVFPRCRRRAVDGTPRVPLWRRSGVVLLFPRVRTALAPYGCGAIGRLAFGSGADDGAHGVVEAQAEDLDVISRAKITHFSRVQNNPP